MRIKNSEVETLSQQLVSAGIAVRSVEKGDSHFLINRRDLFYGKMEQKEDIKRKEEDWKYDIFNPLKPKNALIWIMKKNTVHEITEIVETDPNQ